MRRKGFYLKKGKEGSIYLHLFVPDFTQYLIDIKGSDDWATLRLFERKEADEKGHTHNMEAVQNTEKQNKTTSE
jgi:hypothetical protein